MNDNQEIWEFLDRHLTSIYNNDWKAYEETTAEDLSLYEYFITPHRQDGLDFHQFMIESSWTGRPKSRRHDLFEKRLQQYGDTAIVSYTFLLSQVYSDGIKHRAHNESRVLIKDGAGWKVVHVHKSPASWPPAREKE